MVRKSVNYDGEQKTGMKNYDFSLISIYVW